MKMQTGIQIHVPRGVPKLPLDLPISSQILYRRRGGISGSCSSSYTFTPRKGRRGGISYDRRDKDAIYVRMLGDVQMKSRLEFNAENNVSSSPSEQKFVERIPAKGRWNTRFLSLHKTRKRHRSLVKMSQQNSSLLDQLYCQQAKCLLEELGNWNMDVFHLDVLTSGRPLFHLASHLFQQYNLVEIFHLDPIKLLHTFSLIEEGYHDNNPYHNAVHAADVTQAMHCYLQEQKLRRSVPPFEVMTSLLAAMTHDLDHPGFNQAFLIATGNHLAALYENTSVLENHHWRSAVGLFHESGVFSHFDQQQWSDLECQVRSLILATDITRQQEFLSNFKKFLDSGKFDCYADPGHRHFMLQIALKCADISNPCRYWPLSKQWSLRVCDEFFRQGDYEKKLQVPVTPMCNRKATTVAKIQTGFIDFVVSPLFSEWFRFLPTKLSQAMIQNMQCNKSRWQEVMNEESSKKASSPEIHTENPSEDEDDSKENEQEGDEESDKVEGRLPLTLAYLADDDENSSSYGGSRRGSCRSLSPLRELPEDNWHPELRRHSLPPAYIQKEMTYVTLRRDCLPVTQYLRRRSLPTTMIFHTTSFEKIAGKFPVLLAERNVNALRSVSMEELLCQPKLANLSPSFEASRLLGSCSNSTECLKNYGSNHAAKFLSVGDARYIKDKVSSKHNNKDSSMVESASKTGLQKNPVAMTTDRAASVTASSCDASDSKESLNSERLVFANKGLVGLDTKAESNVFVNHCNLVLKSSTDSFNSNANLNMTTKDSRLGPTELSPSSIPTISSPSLSQ